MKKGVNYDISVIYFRGNIWLGSNYIVCHKQRLGKYVIPSTMCFMHGSWENYIGGNYGKDKKG